MNPPVLVINRAQDTDRLAAFRQSATEFGIETVRIDALDAHRRDFPFALYAGLLRDQFWDSDQIKPGAIGCFLSHRRAWQHVVDHDLPIALVCEDDAEFRTSLDRLENVPKMLPEFDVAFANGRLAAWCAAQGEYDLKPLPQVIADVAELGGPKELGLKTSPGGDCYLVSKVGAVKLLQQTEAQGIFCGVDWLMVWNSLGQPTGKMLTAFPELGILERLDQPKTHLRSFVLADPVADQRKGPSVLKHGVSYPISQLVQRGSEIAHAEAVSTIAIGNTRVCFACRAGPDPVMEAHRSGEIWDEPGLSALLSRFPEGGTFVDVGAHSGNHSVVMAKLGGAGKVIAVEPNPEIHRLLQANMAINDIADRLELHPPGIALSNKSGRGWLIRNRRRSSETMVKAERPDGDEDPTAAVELVTGDEVLSDQTIDAIKVDTAGSEVEVLKGLSATLRRCRPLVLLDHASQSFERIARLADEVGYLIFSTHAASRKNRSSSLLIPRPDGER